MTKPVILCIGTNKVSGDSLGPLVGDLLITKYNINAFVYGRSSNPINGVNYEKYIEHILFMHKNTLIVAVDACVGKKQDVGKIKILPKGLVAGGALNKNYQTVGDISILGIVGHAGKDNFSTLKNVKSFFIRNMADTIAKITVSIVNYNYRLKQIFMSDIQQIL